MTQSYHYLRNNKTGAYLCLEYETGSMVWDFYLSAATLFTEEVCRAFITAFHAIDAERFSDLTLKEATAEVNAAPNVFAALPVSVVDPYTQKLTKPSNVTSRLSTSRSTEDDDILMVMSGIEDYHNSHYYESFDDCSYTHDSCSFDTPSYDFGDSLCCICSPTMG